MGAEAHLPLRFVNCFDKNSYIRRRNHGCSLLRPFCQLEAGTSENIAETRIFPFARIVEAVEVEMPDREVPRLVGFDHGVGRALDAALNTQRTQPVAYQRGLAGAEVAMQRDEGVGQLRQGREPAGEILGVLFAAPLQPQRRALRAGGGLAFYNQGLMVGSSQLVPLIQAWARELGFSQIGVAGVDLSSAEPGLLQWLAQGFHGDMHYMQAHGLKRARPAELVPGTLSVITARMDYLPRATPAGWQAVEWARLSRPEEGIVSLYARGRDYHKVLRARLQKLADRIAEAVGPFGHRVFTDSAPVLEAELASRSGQGWRGKHTLVLNRQGGSMFFLGEIFVDFELQPTEPVSGHCGQCSACIGACPTGAIVAPGRVDARRCISYLTIEHQGSIAPELRPLLANRIYGCDDCQLACPWNKFAEAGTLPDFDARTSMAGMPLAHYFAWDEATFLRQTEGSPIRRIGHVRWLRNIAVALGNALRAAEDASHRAELRTALASRAEHPEPLVREHVAWALAQERE